MHTEYLYFQNIEKKSVPNSITIKLFQSLADMGKGTTDIGLAPIIESINFNGRTNVDYHLQFHYCYNISQ